ncbi:MAG TPA: hypothetical protein VIJ57_06925, partial [Hanamia sp.]
MKKDDKSSSAGTVADNDSTVQNLHFCQPIAKPNVVRSGGQMKHLIFIDNDDFQRSKKEVSLYVTPMLQAYGNLDEEYSTNIEIISDLYKKDKDELYNLFYSGKNAI